MQIILIINNFKMVGKQISFYIHSVILQWNEIHINADNEIIRMKI